MRTFTLRAITWGTVGSAMASTVWLAALDAGAGVERAALVDGLGTFFVTSAQAAQLPAAETAASAASAAGR